MMKAVLHTKRHIETGMSHEAPYTEIEKDFNVLAGPKPTRGWLIARVLGEFQSMDVLFAVRLELRYSSGCSNLLFALKQTATHLDGRLINGEANVHAGILDQISGLIGVRNRSYQESLKPWFKYLEDPYYARWETWLEVLVSEQLLERVLQIAQQAEAAPANFGTNIAAPGRTAATAETEEARADRVAEIAQLKQKLAEANATIQGLKRLYPAYEELVSTLREDRTLSAELLKNRNKKQQLQAEMISLEEDTKSIELLKGQLAENERTHRAEIGALWVKAREYRGEEATTEDKKESAR